MAVHNDFPKLARSAFLEFKSPPGARCGSDDVHDVDGQRRYGLSRDAIAILLFAGHLEIVDRLRNGS